MSGVIAAALLLAVLASLSFSATAADAFISFRYAQNLASGEGLVFNQGERVEGVSNLLWVLLMSLSEAVRLDTVTWAKVIGVASGILALLLTAEIGRKHMNLPHGLVILGLLYVATSAGVVYYSISGLETTLYMLQIVLLSYLLLEGKMALAGLVCGTLVLARPEGVLFLIPLAATLLVRRSGLRATLRTLLTPAAFVASLTAWRWWYYGSLLPHTHYSKIDTSLPFAQFLLLHTKALVLYTFEGFRGSEAILALAVLGAIHLGRKRLLPLAASILAVMAFVWYSAGDWMGFSRFYVPVIPLIALFWVGAADFMRRSMTQSATKLAGLVGLLLVPLLFSVVNTATSIRDLERNRTLNPAMHCRTHIDVARYLAKVSLPADVVAVNEPGAIGYYSGLRVVDMSGKTDVIAARLEREGRLDEYAEYILSTVPQYILLNNRQEPWDTEFHPLHKAVYDKVLATGLYVRDCAFELNYYKSLILFVRKNRDVSAKPN